MFGAILYDQLFAGISVTINAEVAAGVVHANIFTLHTTADFSLAFRFLALTGISGILPNKSFSGSLPVLEISPDNHTI